MAEAEDGSSQGQEKQTTDADQATKNRIRCLNRTIYATVCVGVLLIILAIVAFQLHNSYVHRDP